MKGGHGFEIAVMLRGGDWDEAKSCSKNVHEIKLILGWLYEFDFATQKFMLGKSAKITKNEVSQNFMRF